VVAAIFQIRPLTPLVKTIVVRIVQEFFQNSLKHSGCKTINLNLKDSDEGLLLEMNDDGRGFDAGNAKQHEGIGLQNMKRRAGLIGAAIELLPGLSRGIQLKLFIPSEKMDQPS
jgi:signal transduction histidine kinase